MRTATRIACAVVAGLVGANAVLPGWGMATDGSVYGFKLPTTWLAAQGPFTDYFLPGLLLLVVIGLGGLATALVCVFSRSLWPLASLAMGLVLIGWIGGELVFLTQTMILTWVILGAGVLLVLLSAPYARPQLYSNLFRRTAVAH